MRPSRTLILASLGLLIASASAQAAGCPEPSDATCFNGQPCAGGLSIQVRALNPAPTGSLMLWQAQVQGAAGALDYVWQDIYGSMPGGFPYSGRIRNQVGFDIAKVTVADYGRVNPVTQQPPLCVAAKGNLMYFVPSAEQRTQPPYNQPPSVTYAVWLPRDIEQIEPGMVDAIRPTLERNWRIIRTGFFHQYGETFRMNPLFVFTSTKTEQDICGGDCTDLGLTTPLVTEAKREINQELVRLGGIPSTGYTHAVITSVYGGGGWAASGEWNDPIGAFGELADLTGRQFPPIEADFSFAVLDVMGRYRDALGGGLAHELNHAIGWDEINNFSLYEPPSDYEYSIGQQSPFMTESLDDATPPSASFTNFPVSPASGSVTIEVTASDNSGMDAVGFMVDGQLQAFDNSSPYRYTLDTKRVGLGVHTIGAVAVDQTGNATWIERKLTVANTLSGSSCSSNSPAGKFQVCFYDGLGTAGPFLGEMRDQPFPVVAPNAGPLIKHWWEPDEVVAFGQSATVTGVWRGTINFPAPAAAGAQQLLRLLTSGPTKLYVNDQLVLSTVGPGEYIVRRNLVGPTQLRIEWQHNGGQGIVFLRYQPGTALLAPNNPPTLNIADTATPGTPLNPALPIVAKPGDALDWTLTAADAEDAGSALLLSGSEAARGALSSLGAVLTPQGDGTARFQWTPNLSQEGQTFQFMFEAVDTGRLSKAVTLTVRVPFPQEPRCVDPPNAITNVSEGQRVVILFSCRDFQGGVLAQTTTGLPSGARLEIFGDANLDGLLSAADTTKMVLLQGQIASTPELMVADLNRNGRIDPADLALLVNELFQPSRRYLFAWVPDYTQAGSYPVTATVRDPDNFTDQVVLQINVRNAFPIQDPADQTVPIGHPVRWVFFADDNQDDITYNLFTVTRDGEIVTTYPAGAVFTTLGDVNGDGQLTTEDLTRLYQIANGGQTPTPMEVLLSDFDDPPNGPDSNDYVLLLETIRGRYAPRKVFAWVPQDGQDDIYPFWLVAMNESGYSYSSPVFDLTVLPTCAITTAAYGRPDAPEIHALWAMHRQLIGSAWNTSWHQAYLRWYEKVGPKLAAQVRTRPWLRALIRGMLQSVIRVSGKTGNIQ